jgi:CheY-like chemotaxis protein
VAPVCQSSLRLVKQLAQEKRLKVAMTLDSKVTVINADERRLRQILSNLLTNACKFTPEGGEFGLEVVGDVEAEAVRFTVWDTGIGIAQRDMERLFKPFVQLDSGLSRRYGGTGLGLALVRRLTELHGGGVSVESKGIPGRGSRFTVSLPWATATKSVPEDLPGARSYAPNAEPFLASPLVLLAEDNEGNIAAVADYLQSRGLRVIIARNGSEAVARAKEEKPDLVLMDIQMPEMDGLEATSRIRSDAIEVVATVPIIALTALAMPGDRERCLKAGANGYLSKPVSLRRLAREIKAHLRQT